MDVRWHSKVHVLNIISMQPVNLSFANFRTFFRVIKGYNPALMKRQKVNKFTVQHH
jgi:hypothetical protein